MINGKKPGPGVELSINFISSRIGNGTFEPGKRMPNLEFLASTAGVSKVTMSKAISILKKQGILQGVSGQFTSVADTRPKSLPIDSWSGDEHLCEKQNKWVRIKARIEKDILNCAYGPGQQLPSLKELQHKYGASYPTIIKVVSQLEADETIVRHNKGYMVPDRAPRMSFGRIAFVGSEKAFSNPELLRICESSCIEKGIAADFVVCRKKNGRINLARYLSSHLYDTTESGAAIGFVYMQNEPCDFAREILSHLSQFRKPVAILTKDACMQETGALLSNSLFHTITYANAESLSASAARYLLGLGHRHIAFICSLEMNAWEKSMLSGLNRTYRSAGLEDCISYAPAANANRQSSEIDADDAGMLSAIRRLANSSKATAWVCTDDSIALAALSYLRAVNISVPRHVSVVSFGDTLGAVAAGLTSFNFNYSAAMHQALDHILACGQSFPAYSRKNVCIDGSLVERSTSGKVQSEQHKIAVFYKSAVASNKAAAKTNAKKLELAETAA